MTPEEIGRVLVAASTVDGGNWLDDFAEQLILHMPDEDWDAGALAAEALGGAGDDYRQFVHRARLRIAEQRHA